jgi:hypothetical protein
VAVPCNQERHFGASAAGQTLPHGTYWDLLYGVRTLQCLGADSHWMSGDDQPLVWIPPRAVGWGKHGHWLRTATMPREEFSSPPFVCSHFYSRSQLLKRRRPTLGMFFCLRNVGLPVHSTLPVLVEPVPIFSCAKSGEKGVP